MKMESAPRRPNVVCTVLRAHWHFFVPALAISTFFIVFALKYPDFDEIVMVYDYSWLVFVLLAVSIPFALIDPPVWFTVYMTTFTHFMYFRGLFTLSIVSIVVLFASLFFHTFRRRTAAAARFERFETSETMVRG